MNAAILRALAEHEAGHAVVAAHLGHRVHAVELRSTGDGYTAWDSTRASREHQAAVTAAADVWGRKFGTVPYVDLACDDLARFERQHGLDRLWSASRTAEQILSQRRDAVLALARRLITERSITFYG